MAKLTPKQKRFADEYLIDLNATAAYKRAGYDARGSAAEVNASRLLSNAKVQAYIAERQQARQLRTEIKQDDVLQRWWDLATADPNELTQLRRLCCRHCHGIGHMWQWRDRDEYDKAVELELRQAQVDDRQPAIPSDAGGYGYYKLADPHPGCPKCFGEGVLDLQFMDTRKLSPKARLLFAGVKQTQAGIEVKMHDQAKALENVARHLGMFTDKLEVSGNLTIEQMLANLGDNS